MTYHQITSEERYILATLRTQGLNQSEIARELGRHRSTICRELKRNSARFDGCYRPSKAIERTAGRRSRSRRNQRFTRSDLRRVDAQLRELWSPEQICGRLRGSLSISLPPPRCAPRSVTGRSIPSLARVISTASSPSSTVKPDTSSSASSELVPRSTPITACAGIPSDSKPSPPTTAPSSTTTRELERATGVAFYFATPHHSWERGTNENTNGLIRQYVPKGTSMAKLTQQRCNAIARALNNRPRKRLGFKTPQECFDAI